jgi:hypothetical protein
MLLNNKKQWRNDWHIRRIACCVMNGDGVSNMNEKNNMSSCRESLMERQWNRSVDSQRSWNRSDVDCPSEEGTEGMAKVYRLL